MTIPTIRVIKDGKIATINTDREQAFLDMGWENYNPNPTEQVDKPVEKVERKKKEVAPKKQVDKKENIMIAPKLMSILNEPSIRGSSLKNT